MTSCTQWQTCAPLVAGKLHKSCWSCTSAQTRDACNMFDEMRKRPGAELLFASALGNEVNSGLLLLTSTIDLKGKVELMLIMKTTKTAELSCSMVFNLAARSLQNLDCN
ncbi:unnamed protein product [Prunus armeniaca]